jgi:hypothetical protein
MPEPIAQTDLGQLILLGNDMALQWYSALNDKPAPTPGVVAAPGGGVVPTVLVQQQGTLLIVGALVVAAIVLTRR